MPLTAFWNYSRKNDVRLLVELIEQYGVEILLLAEEGFEKAALISEFSRATGKTLYSLGMNLGVSRVSFYSRFPNDRFTDILDTAYASIKEYKPLLGLSLLLVGVHLPSKLRQDAQDLALFATRVKRWVEQAESQVGHDRTVLVGDFNMNPFEDGMVSCEGLHAVMDRRIAANGSRKVLFEEYSYFYNPMWRFMGDISSSTPGTFFMPHGTSVHYFWETFDQVLVRPSLLSAFRDDDVSILRNIGGRSLLKVPPPGIDANISDHLPLIFNLSA